MFDLVNMAYDPHEQQTEGGDDVSWLFDICGALYMLARERDDTRLATRLAYEAQFSPGLSIRRADPPSLEELAEEEPMMVMFFEELYALNPVW